MPSICPPPRLPRSTCMSQSPWSTVITSVPTLPRMIRAAAAAPAPRFEPPYDALLSAAWTAGVMSCVAWRVDRTAVPIGLWSWSHSVCSEVRRGCCGVGRVVAGDVASSSEPTSSAAPGRRSRSAGSRSRCRRPGAASRPCRPGSSPTSRFSQPIRALEPGSASSTSSIAEKCERLAMVSPAAWTAASVPAVHSGRSGAELGVQPEEPVGGAGEELVLRDGDGRAAPSSSRGRRTAPPATARRRRRAARARRAPTTRGSVTRRRPRPWRSRP